MNIFVLDLDIEKNVQYYCNQHIVKMCVETTQLISNAAHFHGISAPYRETHKNHPCSIWARENYSYLWHLNYFINQEYRYRYGKSVNHKSYNAMLEIAFPYIVPLEKINHKDLNFVQAMPEECRNPDPVIAYRQYYRTKSFAKWSKRDIPDWLE